VALAGTVWKHNSSDHAAGDWRPGGDTEGALMSAENAGTEAPAEVPTEAPAEVPTEAQDVAETEELLVEEISIDGMCGVY
jgi:mycofactocin precursor